MSKVLNRTSTTTAMLVALSATFQGAVVTDSAFAAERASTSVMEEIIVTSRRREERMQDVPLAVTNFTGDDLIRQGVRDLTQLDQQVPSLSVQRVQGTQTGVTMAIRGISAADDLLTTDPAVGLYVDGVIVPHTTAFASNLFDIGRVEVLKGPQGTLYGKNTVGGAVNLIPAKAEIGGNVNGYFSGDFGSDNNVDLTGAVNIPLTETMAIRLAGQSNTRDGYGKESNREFCGTNDGTRNGVDLGAPGFNCFKTGDNDLNDDDERAIRANLEAELSDNLHLSITADYSKVEENGTIERAAHWYPFEAGAFQVGYDLGILSALDVLGFIGAAPPTANGFANFAATDAWVDQHLIPGDYDVVHTGGTGMSTGNVFGVPGAGMFPFGHKYAEARTRGVTAVLEYEFGNGIVLKSTTGYRYMEVNRSVDVDSTLFVITDAPLNTDSDVWTQEFNFSGDSQDGRLTWTAGLFWAREEGSDGSRAAAVPAFNPNNRNIFDFDVENSSIAVYAQGTYNLQDNLRLTLGARYTEEERDFTSRNRQMSYFSPLHTCTTGIAGTSDATGAACETDQSTDADDVSWLASLDYNINEDAMVYLKASRSFRSGAFSGRAATAPAVDPEIAEDIEIGLKADWLDGKLRTNLSFFDMDYEDQQVTAIVNVNGTSATLLQNAASSNIQGFEAEIFMQPTDRLTFRVTASWNENEFDKFPNMFQAQCYIPAGALPADIVTGTPGQNRGSCVRDRGGDEAEGARPWSYSVHGRYEFPVGDLGWMGFQLDWSYQDEAEENSYDSLNSPVGNTALLRDFNKEIEILNARIDLDIPKWGLNVALYGTNLTDEEILIRSADVGLSYTGLLMDEPRLWGIEVRKTIGN